jgi:hypothetical protein
MSEVRHHSGLHFTALQRLHCIQHGPYPEFFKRNFCDTHRFLRSMIITKHPISRIQARIVSISQGDGQRISKTPSATTSLTDCMILNSVISGVRHNPSPHGCGVNAVNGVGFSCPLTTKFACGSTCTNTLFLKLSCSIILTSRWR